MKAAGILDFATALHNPDFAKMAEAAGTLGLKAETPGLVRLLLVDALSHDGPAGRSGGELPGARDAALAQAGQNQPVLMSITQPQEW
jgi:hypothetical protein